MVIQFTVGNFPSSKEPATLSLATSALKEKQIRSGEIASEFEGTNLSLLKSAVIRGASASGKSNLAKALDSLEWFVIDPPKGMQSGEGVRVESFRLNRRTEQEPSYFEAVFADETVQYHYGSEVDRKCAHRKWLYQKDNRRKAKEVELFLRDGDEYELHSKFSVGKEVVAKEMVCDNTLLPSVAAQFSESVSVEIMGQLASTTIVLGSSGERIQEMTIVQIDDPSMKRRIVEFTRFTDFGIDGICKVNNTVISLHQQYNEEGNATKTVTLPFRINELEGAIRYFSLAYPIIDALDHGKRLVVDEFDLKMHSLLTSRIIGLFNPGATNPRNVQLIFTTYGTNLLNASLFRRDQIWLTQKDSFGASKLYSLTEYKARNSVLFGKEYLTGKYGDIPIIDQFERLFDLRGEGYGSTDEQT